ncbi:MAG: lamin tail domain-containing protein [Cyclobacteriaceae bacterium]
MKFSFVKYLIRIILSVILLTTNLAVVNAQLSDDFSDGDFTNNPTWSGINSFGTTDPFEIAEADNQLKSQALTGGSSTRISYLSTQLTSTLNLGSEDMEWSFRLKNDFTFSGTSSLGSTNHSRVYLVSDAADLSGDINGYYIQLRDISNGDEEIRLYRQTGGASSQISLDGSLQAITSEAFVSVRVTRSSSGLWEVFVNDSPQGSATDATHLTSDYFGVQIRYTANSRSGLFYFDDFSVSTAATPLVATEVSVNSNTSITLSFNQEVDEASAENSFNYTIDNGITVSAATKSSENNNEVLIQTSELATGNYDLTIANVADAATVTPMANSVTLNFDYLQVELDDLITVSDTELQLTFNDNLDQASAEMLANYSVDNSIGQPNSATINTSNAKAVNITFDGPFQALTNYTLEYGKIRNSGMNSEIEAGSTTNFTYVIPLTIENIEVLSKNELEVTFNLELDEVSAENPPNYNIDNDIGTPASAVLDNDDSKIVTLTLGTDLSQDSYTITLNDIEDAANNAISPGTTANFDYLPLVISEVEVLGATEIEITFNQTLDQASAQTIENYDLDFEIETITSAVQSPDNSAVVTLTLGTAMVNNTYQLTINNVQNLSGNATAENLTASVEFVTPTDFRSIVINEIFADPTPTVGLPDSEFIEFTNLSDKSIDLGGFDLTGGSIGELVLGPNEYVILAPSSNTADFESFGDVIGVSSWNTLSNGGEQILLKDNLGNLVDSLTYDSDWHDDSKTDGGYSLEQINPEIVCNYYGNWTSSLYSQGGTPGSENSVFDNTSDEGSPNLLLVEVIEPTKIRLVFDEPMDITSLDAAEYTVTTGTATLVIDVIEASIFSVLLTLEEALVSGNTYDIAVTNATDCERNLISINTASIDYDIDAPVLEQIIIRSLNEIELVFDKPLDESIAEKEENYLAGNGLENPASAILDESTQKNVTLSFESDFSPLQENTLDISNLEDLKDNALVAPIETSFAYDQSIDSVVVKSANQIDIFYNRTVDETTASKASNYSVDQDAGNPKLVYVDEINNRLFHLIFENELDNNKELTLSTVDIHDNEGNYLPTPEYYFTYDTRGPKVTDVVVVSNHSLAVMFDEKVEQSSAESIENYAYDEVYSDSRTLQQNDSTVLLEFREPFDREVVYELSIDNIKDLVGNEMSSKATKEFVYDVFPPELDSILVKSPSELILIFNESLDEVSANSITNFIIGDEVTNPNTASLNVEKGNELLLSFSSDFSSESDIPITISGLMDTRGNIIENPVESSFNLTAFYISNLEAISSTEIEILYNKKPDLNQALSIANYQVGDETISNIEQVTEKDSGFVITLEGEMEDNSTHYLEVPGIIDESGNGLAISNYEFSFDSRFDGLNLEGENTIELVFEVGISETSFSDLTFFTLSPDDTHPIAAIPDSKDNKIVKLVFEQNILSNVDYILSWPQLSNEFGNLIPAYSVAFSKDRIGPELKEVTPTSENSVQVTFTEALNPTTAEILLNYDLAPDIGEIVTIDYEDKTVEITFADDFSDGTTYTLTVKNVKDQSGNIVNTSSLSFDYVAPYIPKAGELLITEIMADPSPAAGLPEVEYLEIFNNSDQNIILNNIILADRTSYTTLSSDTLAAQSYMLLTSTSSLSLFSNENKSGVSGFPSLGNSGDSLTLSISDGTILDKVVYEDNWYRSEVKSEGGYSLERLTILEKCLPELNWIASDNEFGGTPGEENSLFNIEPDETMPEIVDIELVNTSSIKIVFSEAINSESLLKENFTLSGDLEANEIILSGNGLTDITLNLLSSAQPGELYSLNISNVKDCAGNLVEPFEYNFGTGETPGFNELIISEIMADSEPEVGQPQSEYIELYNPSNKNIELSGLTLVDETGSAILPNYILSPQKYLLLTPSGNDNLFGQIDVLPISNWRSLSNGGETITIYSGTDLVFSISYDQSWYKDSSKENGGWSLEMISLNNPCGGYNNWTASTDASGGTPGKVNSVQTTNPDNLGPQLVTAIAQTSTSIKLVFDEKLHPKQFQNSSFTIDPNLSIESFTIDSPESTSAIITLSESISSLTTYRITAASITDCMGNFIRDESTSAVFVLPENASEGDIIINEILFNPRSGGVDFVEVYNKSQKAINLKSWQLANYNSSGNIAGKVITSDDLIFESGQFLVFTSDPIILKADYPSGDESTFVEVQSLPSFPDSEGSVILLDSLSVMIDSFDYSADYHFNLLDDVDGISLERISFDGSSNDPNNWKSAASTAGFATPGLMNSQYLSDQATSGTLTIEPKVFVPDNTGMNDFTTIRYDLNSIGNFANINIYDSGGRLVRTVVQGGSLSSSGFFTWDGTDNSGSLARAGYYAIYFEVYDSEGNKNIMKETVVLGVKF